MYLRNGNGGSGIVLLFIGVFGGYDLVIKRAKREMEQNSKREREPTQMGWEEGQYKKESSGGSEWKLRLLIFGLGLLCICAMLGAAIAAYIYV